MRVALIAPLIAPIAPPYLGGAQVVVRDLAAGLAARGHGVTLYAADGSAVPGVRTVTLGINSDDLRSLYFHPEPPESLTDRNHSPDIARETGNPAFLAQAHHFLRIALHITTHASDYDLVNAHAYDWPAFVFGALLPLPILQTLHNHASSHSVAAALRTLAQANPANTRLAAVSHTSAASYATIDSVTTVL